MMCGEKEFEKYLHDLGYSDKYINSLLAAKRHLENMFGRIPSKEEVRDAMWRDSKTKRKYYYKFLNLYEHYLETKNIKRKD